MNSSMSPLSWSSSSLLDLPLVLDQFPGFLLLNCLTSLLEEWLHPSQLSQIGQQTSWLVCYFLLCKYVFLRYLFKKLFLNGEFLI